MNFWFDLKYALRLVKKSWGFMLMCAGVVALGTALTLLLYLQVYAYVLKPLGFPNSERWYSLQVASANAMMPRPNLDVYTYQEMLKNSRSIEYLGAFENRAVVLSEGQASTTLRAAVITPQLLAATHVAPHLGRTFQPTDGQTEAAPVAVLSFDAWQTYFASDLAIIGKTARIDSAPVQIIGVMPKDFYAFQDFEIWLPLQLPNVSRPSDSKMTLAPFIVLGNNQKLETVANEIKTAVDKVNSDYPDLYSSTRHIVVIPAQRMYTHENMPIVMSLAFMCVSVLLLGCVDTSMVFLARLLERSREIALRSALGASRLRLLLQVLMETAPVIPLGLIVGYILAALELQWGDGLSNFSVQIRALGRPAYLPTLAPIHLLVAALASIMVWLLSSLIPAWRITRQDAAAVLAGSGKGTSLRSSNKSVGVLVGLQVVIACLVLVACGNMVLGVRKELRKSTGLNTEQVMLSTYPTVFDARYSSTGRRVRYWDDLSAAVTSQIPGAEAAFATAVPTRPVKVAAVLETQQGREREGKLSIPFAIVSDNYFRLMGISLRSGRLFDSTDNSDSLKVAVIDEQLASVYWPNQEVLGKRFQLNPVENGPWLTIVGVVSAVASQPYGTDVGVVYQPMRQAMPEQFQLLVKLPLSASDSRAAIRAAAFSVDRDLPLHNLQTLNDYLAALDLGYMSLVPSFIVVAIMTSLLAAAGLFGIISRSVAQRTQEVGIRRALGATPWQATAIFLRQGAMYLSGALVGIGLGIMLTNVLSATITNILDHVVLVTVSVVFLIAIVIFTASHLPSRRAVAMEPGDALRYE
jgi:putative ABC transport system permease protein